MKKNLLIISAALLALGCQTVGGVDNDSSEDTVFIESTDEGGNTDGDTDSHTEGDTDSHTDGGTDDQAPAKPFDWEACQFSYGPSKIEDIHYLEGDGSVYEEFYREVYTFEYEQQSLVRVEMRIYSMNGDELYQGEILLEYENDPNGAKRLAGTKMMYSITHSQETIGRQRQFYYDDLGFLSDIEESDLEGVTENSAPTKESYFYRDDHTLQRVESYDCSSNDCQEVTDWTNYYVDSLGRITSEAMEYWGPIEYQYGDYDRLVMETGQTDYLYFDFYVITYNWAAAGYLESISDKYQREAYNSHKEINLSYDSDLKLNQVTALACDLSGGSVGCNTVIMQRDIVMTNEGSSCAFELFGNPMDSGYPLSETIPNTAFLLIYGRGDVNSFFRN